MTDKSQGNGPGQGEAPTQQMPRVPKDDPKAETDAAKPSSSGAAAKPANAKPANAKPANAKPAGAAKDTSGQEPSVSARQPLSRPAGGASSTSGGPRKPLSGLSKDEYTRTTKASPDTTSVIPAVTEDGPTPQSKGEGVPRTTKASAPQTTKADAPKKTPATQESKPAVQVEPDPAPAAPGRATLRLRYVEPWSVTRLAFVVSVALMIVGVVAVAVFWLVLQVTGVWSALNDSVANILSDDAGGFDVTEYFGFGRLVGLTLVLSALNVVFMTALATIAAHLYNLAAQILGGIKLTFSDEKK